MISFAKILLNAIQPGIEALGRFPGTDVFCEVNQYPMAIKTPGILTIRIKSALLCFANANFVKERYREQFFFVFASIRANLRKHLYENTGRLIDLTFH